ncbi:hypothetical protein ACSS6W_001298 [Trichoderma asperelloides]
MTILSVFGAVLGTALPGRANVVRLRRAPAAAVVWSTQTHIKTERLLDRGASRCTVGAARCAVPALPHVEAKVRNRPPRRRQNEVSWVSERAEWHLG